MGKRGKRIHGESVFLQWEGNDMENWNILDSKVELDTVTTLYESKETKPSKNYLVVCRNRLGQYSELYRVYFDTYQEAVDELRCYWIHQA